MTYGWGTFKAEDTRYLWQVYRVEYRKPLHVLETGEATTRARAAAQAKKAVMRYRSKASRGASENSLGIY